MEANGKHSGPGHEPGGALPPIVAPRRLPGPQTGGVPSDQNGAAQLRHILDALRRRWLLVGFLGLVAGGSAGAAVWYFMPTPYTATAQLRVNPNTRFFYSDRETGEQTVRFEDYKKNLMFMAKSPMVILSAMRLKPDIGDGPTLRGVKEKDSWLEGQLSVSAKGTEYVAVSLTSPHKEDLADIVNAVVDALMQEVVDKEQAQRKADIAKFREVAEGERRVLAQKEGELDVIDRRIRTSSQALGGLSLQDLRAERLQVRTQLGNVKMQLIQYAALRPGLPEMIAEQGAEPVSEPPLEDDVFNALYAGDPEFRSLYFARQRAEDDLRMAKGRFNPDIPVGAKQIQDAEQHFAKTDKALQEFRVAHMPSAREKLRKGVGQLPPTADPAAVIAQLETEKSSLESEFARLSNDIANLEMGLIDQDRLLTEVNEKKRILSQYDEVIRKREVEMDNGRPPVAASEIMRATVPRTPDQAKQMKMAGVAGFGLFGAVGALIVWLEMLTRKVNRVTDVEQELHLQLIGSVPAMPRFAMKASDSGERSSKAAYWHSVLTESIDSARTLLLRYAKTSRLKRVMIASATGGEGKTSVSCHLATSLARAGRRVLLMDCDIRRPSIHWVFGLENGPGFCELLTREATPDEAVQEASPAGLHILPAGHVNSEVLRRLTQDDLEELLEQIGAGYDFVIIDTSPILPVTDALMFAQHVDGVLFSIRRDVSRMSKVQTAVQRLAMLGAPLLGAVAIGLDEGVYGTRYQYKYNGYAYGRHPSQDEPNGALTTSAAGR